MNINATLLGQAIAFILFVWFCMKYVWPPIISAIETRQQTISDGLQAANQAKKDQVEVQKTIEEKLELAKKNAANVIEQANKRKMQILDEAREEAQQEREKILLQAQAELESERNRARDELRKQLGALVISGAEKVLERAIDQAANQDIIDRVSAEL